MLFLSHIHLKKQVIKVYIKLRIISLTSKVRISQVTEVIMIQFFLAEKKSNYIQQ